MNVFLIENDSTDNIITNFSTAMLGSKSGYMVEIHRKESPWTISQYINGTKVQTLKYSITTLIQGINAFYQYFEDTVVEHRYGVTCDMKGVYLNFCLHDKVQVHYKDGVKFFDSSSDVTFDIHHREFPDEPLLMGYEGKIDIDTFSTDQLFNAALEYPHIIRANENLTSKEEMYQLGWKILRSVKSKKLRIK